MSSFKYTKEKTTPKLGVYKKEWDLQKHYYKNENDPQIEKDISEAEKVYSTFAKKFAHKDVTKNNTELRKALLEYKKLHTCKAHKPAHYLSYRLSLNAQDVKAEKKLNLIETRLTKLANSILFFELTLTKISTQRQKEILNDLTLSEFMFFLCGIFKTAKHTLSEPEEKILALKAQTSRSLWVSGTEKILGATSIDYKGKKVPLNAALMQFPDLPKKERHLMWNACLKELIRLGPVAENELNAIVIDKKINDELRGYKTPYTQTAFSYDQEEKHVKNMIDVVSKKGYALSQKFYAHKAKLLGGKIDYIDRDDFKGTMPKVSYALAVDIVRDVFYGFNKMYGEIFDNMLKTGQIDVFPKQGKVGGAYCSSGTNVPTFVFLNHSNEFDSVKVLAHEMGHAVHAQRSKVQSILYEDHSIVTAETASTFFEAVLVDHLLPHMNDAQKMVLLNNSICDRINTIMMCVARFSSELEIHETIRAQGAMTWKEMGAVLVKHFKKYCGKSINVGETDGYGIVAKMHYRLNFYQYTYAFGGIASGIMFRRCKNDSAYKKKVDDFLCAGRSASVEDIFSAIDISITSKKTLEEGLALLEKDINTFVELTKASRYELP